MRRRSIESVPEISLPPCISPAPVEFTDSRGKGGGGGTRSNDREKAWSSRNHSTFNTLTLWLGPYTVIVRTLELRPTFACCVVK